MTSPFTNFPIPTVLGVSLTAQNQDVSGGAFITPFALTPGNITVNPGLCPIQTISNIGAFTFTAPNVAGSCIVIVTNSPTAGAISFSGFNAGSNTGVTPTNTNGSSFTIFFFGSGTINGYFVYANQ